MHRLLSIILVLILPGHIVFNAFKARGEVTIQAPEIPGDSSTFLLEESADFNSDPSQTISFPVEESLERTENSEEILFDEFPEVIDDELQEPEFPVNPQISDEIGQADTLATDTADFHFEQEPIPQVNETNLQQSDASSSIIPEDPVSPVQSSSGSRQSEGPALVDFTAKILRPIQITEDSTALNLLNDVVFSHNGAVITCDSAVRYSDKRMDCFKRVVINKGTTYIYGDKVEYNGETNTAKVFAPIIKMVDEDAVLYTYQFSFNTLDNIGRYGGGGTMTQNENLMESKRGYYYVDTREFIGVDSVELRNEEYRMMSDSVSYNIDTEVASFYTLTYIWNDKGEILSAEAGRYFNASADYRFTSEAYILTEDQEVWADSIDYNSRSENAILRNNVQLRDDEQYVMAFGDYGEYWGGPRNAMMTRDAQLISFDPQEPDSLYMRSDSMFLYTFDRSIVFNTTPRDGSPVSSNDFSRDEELIQGPEDRQEADGENPEFEQNDRDSLSQAAETPVKLTREERREEKARQKAAKKEEKQLKKEERRAALLESLVPLGSHCHDHEDDHDHSHDHDGHEHHNHSNQQIPNGVAESSLIPHESGSTINGNEYISHPEDTVTVINERIINEIHNLDSVELVVPEPDGDLKVAESYMAETIDTTTTEIIFTQDLNLISPDSVDIRFPEDSLVMTMGIDSLPAATSNHPDSIQRVVRAYRDVRIFREDFQAVCDSLVGFSIDSTLHMYINPVLWNENNQIKSDVIDIFTKNEQLYKAEFTGSPLMASEVDSIRYNQIKGRFMEAWFRDNAIYRNDVIGNAQTYYYMQEDDTDDLMGFLVAESADITFLINENRIDTIIYRLNPVWDIFPMNKIPLDQEQLFPDFVWEANRRPNTKEDVFTRHIRPTQREIYIQKEEPTFPLTDRIISDRDRMIREGIWRERNDLLSEDALRFIRSVEMDAAE